MKQLEQQRNSPILVGRPLLFRGYDRELGRMLTSEELAKASVAVNRQGMLSCPDRIVLMQYSGTKDEFGMLVYEGDICDVDMVNDFGSNVQMRGVMAWIDPPGHFSVNIIDNLWGKGNPEYPISRIRAIGNIFEHKDLLKKHEEKETG